MNRTDALMVALISLVMAGCSRKQPPVTPSAAENTPSAPATESNPVRSSQPDAEDAARRERERNRAALTEMVFFDYDRSELGPEARAILDRKVPILRGNSDVVLSVEGHADERGSVEYNLALGLRRAAAVREYLAGFGISAERLELQSFGEERPISAGTGEDAWSRNRRAEFRITGGILSNTP